MIRLNSENISESSASHLASKQADINSKSPFESQVDRASSLWDSKTGSIAGRNAFENIKETLIGMCVGVEICNYCENNEATDIEHIFPKSHFPGKAFQWENYLLACKICNTTYKLDQFSVFNPAKTNTITKIERDSGKPDTEDPVLINPRQEDPMDFLYLDIKGKTFRFGASPNLNKRDQEKAEYTINLLGLNDRDALVAGRKAAANYFISRLEKYVLIKEAKDFPSLVAIVNDLDFIDTNKDLEMEKQRLMISVKNEILRYAHPTIWKEFIRQRGILPKTNNLFHRAEEALTWI